MGPAALFDHQYRLKGYQFIAGVDEVGVGCLAGPVVAAAVILPSSCQIEGVTDSKQLSAKKRKELSEEIFRVAIAYAIAFASVEEVDDINILQASRLAMKRALESLKQKPDFVLIDGRNPVSINIAQATIIKGDALSLSIGAASIIAKVYRDEWMERLDSEYPGYLFAKHKGYGTVEHRQALQKLGRSQIHRKSFSWTAV